MKTRLLNTILLCTSFVFSPVVFSGEGHSHDAPEHKHAEEQIAKEHTHGHEPAKEHAHGKPAYTSPKEAWQTLNTVVVDIEKNIESSNFRAVDDQNHALEDLIAYLQKHSQIDDVQKQKRLEGALKQLKSAVGELHEQGHHPTQEGLRKTVKRVRGAMKLVEAQQVF